MAASGAEQAAAGRAAGAGPAMELARLLREWMPQGDALEELEDRLYTDDEWANELAVWLADHGVVVRAAPLAGPETAAEHIRNALMILDGLRATLADLNIYKVSTTCFQTMPDLDAARARLRQALAQLEGK